MAEYKGVFPTRFGQPQGSSTERTMLDAVGGADGIRSRVQQNPDGAKTLLKTRSGMPKFLTDAVEQPTAHLPYPPLYFRLVSENYPYGASTTANLDGTYTASTKFEWPTDPVSFSKISAGQTPKLKPKTFAYLDGPGNMTWEDIRGTPATTSVLTWNSIRGGRSGRFSSSSGMKKYYDANHATIPEYPDPLPNPTPGGWFPGQGARFVSPGTGVAQPTKLYDDGVDTGVSGLIIAACKYVGEEGAQYRTIEAHAASGTYAEWLWLRSYDTSGVLLSEVFLSFYTVPGLEEIPIQCLAEPKFNSAGTQAAMVLSTRNSADTVFAAATVLVDASNGTLSASGAEYGHFERSQNGANPGAWPATYDTGERAWDITLTHDWVGVLAVEYDAEDALQIMWQQNTSRTHQYGGSEVFKFPLLGNGESVSLTSWISLTTDIETSSTLYVNSAKILEKQNARSFTDEYALNETFHYEEVFGTYVTSVSGSGSSISVGSHEEYIGNACGDLRRGWVLAAVTDTHYGSRTTTHTGSGVAAASGIPGALDHVCLSEHSSPNADYSGVRIVLINTKTLSVRELINVPIATLDSVPGSWTDTGRHGLPNIGITDPLNPDGLVPNNFTTHVDGWSQYTGVDPRSHAIDSLFFAVDKKNRAVVVSGVAFSNFPPEGDEGGISLANFVPFNLLYDVAFKKTYKIRMPSYGDAVVFMTEPIFFNKEVTPP